LFYFTWTIFSILAAGISGIAHELGHYLVGKVFGWGPSISFSRGGQVSFSVSDSQITKVKDFICLAAGPIATFSLALLGIFLLKSFSTNKWMEAFFFCIAYWNSVFRLSVFIDGKGSDEYKMSQIIGISYSIEVVSVLISLILSLLTLEYQTLLPKSPGLILVLFMVCAASYKLSFGFIAKLFDRKTTP
jgi:cytochrome c oxidase subunit IV